ncbi:hypothetical protein IT418_01895 [bacterium]|nr:hypothetical protein [bacterium]
MRETEVINVEWTLPRNNDSYLWVTLEPILQRVQGRLLIACGAGIIRSGRMKAQIPVEIQANNQSAVGYDDLNFINPDNSYIREGSDGLVLIHKRGVLPFNRILLATGNYGEPRLANLMIIQPLRKSPMAKRLSQIITIDMIG